MIVMSGVVISYDKVSSNGATSVPNTSEFQSGHRNNYMGFVFKFWTYVLNTSSNISTYLLLMLLLYVFATETDDFA